MGDLVIAPATIADLDHWSRLRHALWDTGSIDEHAAEIAAVLATPGETLNLMARTDTGEAIGFAEASLRRDYVNGCETSPVAFLEGIYVLPEFRRRGVAQALVGAVEAWARQQGCTELASDAAIDNIGSQAMHHALGFEETQRVVYFRKLVGPAAIRQP